MLPFALSFFPRHMVRPWRFLFILFVLVSLKTYGRHVPITILHTTDLHGHLLPSEDYEGNAESGGLLACATVIGQVREAERNVMLVDCGDLIQGGIESWVSRGMVMIRALEWLNYDAWTLGNHEFDWGGDALQRLHDATTLNILAANISEASSASRRFSRVRPFIIKDIDGIRVAIIGLTTPAVSSWIPHEILGDVEFHSSVDILPEVLRSVRACNPDILIAVIHQGAREFGDDDANEINAIASRFPELDVIIGGHTHRAVRSVQINGVLYTQAGYHGHWLGRVDLVFDTVSHRLIRREADLIPMDSTVPPCEPLRKVLRVELDKASALAETQVGSVAEEIASSVKLPGQSPLQQLISSAIAEKTKADVVLHGVFSGEGLKPGPITMVDIWKVVPYENRLGILYVTPAELRMILEENLNSAGSTRFLGIYGMGYDLDMTAPEGSRIRNLAFLDGTHPHGRRRLKLVTSSYALASGGGRHKALSRLVSKPEARFEMSGIDTRTAVIDYIRKHSPLYPKENKDVRLVPGSRR